MLTPSPAPRERRYQKGRFQVCEMHALRHDPPSGTHAPLATSPPAQGLRETAPPAPQPTSGHRGGTQPPSRTASALPEGERSMSASLGGAGNKAVTATPAAPSAGPGAASKAVMATPAPAGAGAANKAVTTTPATGAASKAVGVVAAPVPSPAGTRVGRFLVTSVPHHVTPLLPSASSDLTSQVPSPVCTITQDPSPMSVCGAARFSSSHTAGMGSLRWAPPPPLALPSSAAPGQLSLPSSRAQSQSPSPSPSPCSLLPPWSAPSPLGLLHAGPAGSSVQASPAQQPGCVSSTLMRMTSRGRFQVWEQEEAGDE